MQTTATHAIRNAQPVKRSSLVDTITSLHSDCSNMRNELHDAQRKIDKLKRQLARKRVQVRPLPNVDIASLRRNTPTVAATRS